MTLRIGLIADTHGLLRPQALAALEGCDHILHAGDIGKPEILDALRQLAPLSVVRGNNDTQDWAQAIPHDLSLQLGAPTSIWSTTRPISPPTSPRAASTPSSPATPTSR